MLADRALADARQAESEIGRGPIGRPLDGVSIAVNDRCWTQGVPTTTGMDIYQGFGPDRAGTGMLRLRDTGAVILGTLQLSEGSAELSGWHTPRDLPIAYRV